MAILKEFDLDIPYEKDKEKRNQFRDEIRCVASLYERYFGKLKTEGCWKVLIECVDEVKNSKVRDLLGVYTIEIPFKIDNFFKTTNIEKKKMALEALKIGIDMVVYENKWDINIFNNAYDKIIKSNYKNVWMWKKTILNPTKEYRAEVLCEHDINSFDISVIIRKRDGNEIKRFKVKSTKPNEFAYSRYLGNIKWISSNEVVLIDKDGVEQWREYI